MKSSHCRTRWHDRCASVMENPDGSANVCECLCHHRQIEYSEIDELETQLEAHRQDPVEGGPPPYPASIDHGRWRIAEEPSGTDPNLPWQSTRCVECREQVWAKNPRTIEREEAVCETCYYMTVSEYYEEMAKKQRRISLRFHNPFEL